jgi:hypothetical protein
MGGAIFNNGKGTVTITNCTLTGNRAFGGPGGGAGAGNGQGLGGAIFNVNGTLNIYDSSISGNTADQGGRGIYSLGTGGYTAHVNLSNTIVGTKGGANEFQFNTTAVVPQNDLLNVPASEVAQLTGNGDVLNADPQLAPLANNGGPTYTMMPYPGSPVIDAGDSTASGLPSTEQRGYPRTQGSKLDIGAVQTPASQTITFDPLPQHTFGDADFTLSATASSGLPVSFTATGAATVTPVFDITTRSLSYVVHITGTGNVTITAHQPGNAQWTAAPDSPRTFPVIRAESTATVTATTRAYNGLAFQPSVSVTGPGGLDDTNPADFTITYEGADPSTIYALSLAGPVHPGEYKVTVQYKGDADHNASPSVSALFVITKAASTTTFSMPGGTYNGTAFTPLNLKAGAAGFEDTDPSHFSASYFGVTYFGGATPDLVVSYPMTDVAPVHAGSYQVIVQYLGNADYMGSTASASYSIDKANQTITWASPAAIGYGTALSGAQLDATVSVVGPAAAGALTYGPPAGTVLHAGKGQVLLVTAAETSDYNPASASVTIDVNPAVLTVTANNTTRVYGSALPALTASYSVFVNGDTPASLTTPPVLSSAPPTSHMGVYGITAGGAGDPDYTITYIGGTLTITPAPLTITPSANQSKVYGAAVPALTYTFSGLVNHDPPSTFTGALGTTATVASPVGSYSFTTTGLSAGSNYTIVLVANAPTFAVTRADLYVKATANSKTYGQTASDTGSVRGVVNGDGISASFWSPGDPAAAPVGTGSYTITATLSDPQNRLSNYTIHQTTATLTVNKAPLTITALDQTKLARQANPPFFAHSSGFVLGQGPGVLGGTLRFSTPATTSSPPGMYAITPGGLTSGNYAIRFVPGTLNVLSASQATMSILMRQGGIDPKTLSYLNFSQATANLLAQVDAAGLGPATQNPLDADLQAALASFRQANPTAGATQLKTFLKYVSAQRGITISTALADALTASAQRIVRAME